MPVWVMLIKSFQKKPLTILVDFGQFFNFYKTVQKQRLTPSESI